MVKYSYRHSQINKKAEKIIKKVEKFEWKHRNLILLAISVIFAYYVLKSEHIFQFLSRLESLGYIGSLIIGAFLPYGLTVAPATATIYLLSKNLNPALLAFFGAFGAAISDYMIFRFVRDRLMREIKLLSEEIDKLTKPVSSLVFTDEIRVILWRKISRSKIWKTLIPMLAGFIIASPLPDELGAALFGAVKFDQKKFLTYVYSLHFLGILTIALIGAVT